MNNPAKNEITFDPLSRNFTDPLTHEFRTNGFRVNIAKVNFKVCGNIVPISTFFSQEPFTKTYFRSCVNAHDSREKLESIKVEKTPTPIPVPSVTAKLENTSNTNNQGGVSDPSLIDTSRNASQVVANQASTSDNNAKLKTNSQTLKPPSRHILAIRKTPAKPSQSVTDHSFFDVKCKDTTFGIRVTSLARELILSRNKFITEEDQRKDELQFKINRLNDSTYRKNMQSFVKQSLFSPPQPMYLKHPNNDRWNFVINEAELASIQEYVNKTCPLKPKITAVKRFSCPIIEKTYIDVCESFNVINNTYIPHTYPCGENNQFLMWRTYCPTEEQMKAYAWNMDMIQNNLLRLSKSEPRSHAYVASTILIQGGKWCNLQPETNCALLVRICIGNCSKSTSNVRPNDHSCKVGEREYAVFDGRMMIPAFLVIF